MDDVSSEGSAQLGIRRAGDACFHPVEEEVPEGYIVDGILIRREDVVETTTDAGACARRVLAMKLPEQKVSADEATAQSVEELSLSPAGGGQGRGDVSSRESLDNRKPPLPNPPPEGEGTEEALSEPSGKTFSLISALRDVPILFFDVETTGASTEFGDRVIEVGMVRVESGQVVAEYQQLLDPRRRIGRGITALTGITPEMCAGQPTFADALPRMLELMQGAALAGHNVRFDLSFFIGEFRKCGRDLGAMFGHVPVFDTVRIARRRFGRGGNGLQALAPRLGIQPTAAHRALADAQTTAGVFDRLMHPVGGWSMMLCDAMKHQGGPMNVLPTNPRERILPLELEEALDRRGPVMMEYLDANDSRTQRVIEPLEVRRFKGELMLIAHCQLRNDRRTFKLERIVQLTRIEPAGTPDVV
jgi:DNA polymerase III subunit epsilon